jgi:hypothetical protein
LHGQLQRVFVYEATDVSSVPHQQEAPLESTGLEGRRIGERRRKEEGGRRKEGGGRRESVSLCPITRGTS